MTDPTAALHYDVLIAGGEVLDPGAGIAGRYDVAIADGRIVAVAPTIERQSGRTVIDASGLIVTPGLIDLHTHIYWGVTYWGIEADPVAARTGVTTWIDAGSAGAYTLPGFQRYVAEANRARVLALLNLSSIGLVAPTWEFSNLDYCDVALAAELVESNRGLVVGIKARIDANTTRGTGIVALERARVLADRVDLPLMVHISNGPPARDAIMEYLRAGDILTHCCTGGTHRLVDDDGAVPDFARHLQERGIILDLGHGTGSFSYEVAEAHLAQGIVPDVLSSDIHQLSVQGPMFDLPTTMSKYLNLGMSLADVIERATARPARAIRRPDLGTLRVGSVADVALFRLEQGDLTFYDVLMQPRPAQVRLVNVLTMVSGTVLEQSASRPFAPWAVLPPHQTPILSLTNTGRRE